ncbi:TlpA family protein disulfide reductase [Salmonirosea aquatica]|uniref:Redoxin family protein n=1 Tax=Salmonirosea aquatica TaxID=2654236 RepID=A0A7C9BEK3_9BACT|nr:redoxin family protein [Cytophagaceae bacterium SJW1-29]
MKTILALSIGILFALFSCNTTTQEDADLEGTPVKGGPVVVSFKNPHDIDARLQFFSISMNDSTWTGKMHLATLYYDDTQSTLNDNSDKPDMIFDTLAITPANDYLVFSHSVNYFDANEYILQKGDSVQIEYKNKRPRLTFQNRKILKYDANFDSLARSYFKQDQYSPVGKFLEARGLAMAETMSSKEITSKNHKLTFPQKKARNLGIIADFRNKFYAETKTYLSKENSLLDSLKSIKGLSAVPYYFYKERNKYLGYLLDALTDRLSQPQITAILKEHQVNRLGYPDIYYQQFLEAIEEKYIQEKVNFIDNDKPSLWDYRQVFDQVDTSSLFPEKDRNYLLTKEIKRIHDTFSHDDFIAYFKKYESKVKDKNLVNAVRQDFALEFDDRRSETGSVVLTDLSGKKMTFDEVKARHKGKVIYVDFWASWCGPCREAMPASADLRKALKDKKVVFVYLSIDGSIKPWQKASEIEKLSKYAENYLIVNTSTSDFLKQNKLNTIPRYMIFDKTGRLTHANAPRVESGGVGLLLTSLAGKP